MSAKQQERLRARRQAERTAQHAAAMAARHRRRRLWWLGAGMVGLVGAVIAIIVTGGPDAEAAFDPAAEPMPTAEPTATPEPADPPVVPEDARTWDVTLETSAGVLRLELDGTAAPQAVTNFVTLAQDGFFDDTQCHRLTVEGIYVLQCGDPTGTGTGGPGYTWGPIENAPTDNMYPAGTVAMARVGGDAESMGSQFFLVYADSFIPSDSAGGYTVFGQVTGGMDVLEKVAEAGIAPDAAPRPAVEVTIERVETK